MARPPHGSCGASLKHDHSERMANYVMQLSCDPRAFRDHQLPSPGVALGAQPPVGVAQLRREASAISQQPPRSPRACCENTARSEVARPKRCRQPENPNEEAETYPPLRGEGCNGKRRHEN